MTKLTIDSELREKLGGFHELVEFRDEAGRLVGFFHPVPVPSDAQHRRTASPISDEAIEVARTQRTGRPLGDILADLDRTDSQT
jgi:hypothetical protein